MNVPVKEFQKSVNIWESYAQEFNVMIFDSRCRTLFCLPDISLFVCILYSLLSKAIHMGSVPGTITFSCQPAACSFNFRCNSFIIRSLYRFYWILIFSFFVRFRDCQLVFFICMFIVYFPFCTIAIHTALNSVACRRLRAFQ